jgi:hypothetical protein
MHDMNQAIAVLSQMHHWTLQTHNRHGVRYCYSCTIWDRPSPIKRNGRTGFVGGRRATAHGKTPLIAIAKAMEKVRDKKLGTGLKVVGG